MTNASEDDLADALRRRLTIIGDENSRRDPAAHMERLRQISDQIEQISSALPRPMDPQLEHYLARRSYDKALDLLEARASSRLGDATKRSWD